MRQHARNIINEFCTHIYIILCNMSVIIYYPKIKTCSVHTTYVYRISKFLFPSWKCSFRSINKSVVKHAVKPWGKKITISIQFKFEYTNNYTFDRETTITKNTKKDHFVTFTLLEFEIFFNLLYRIFSSFPIKLCIFSILKLYLLFIFFRRFIIL
jgi:hypothetical protein